MWLNDNAMKDVIVIKIGTNAIIDQNGDVDLPVVRNVAAGVAELKANGKHVLLVTSGAVGAAQRDIDPHAFGRISPIELAQIQSSVGQPLLMKCFRDAFSKYSIIVAQGLLTRSDFADRERQVSVKNILEKMLSGNIVPVVNENDFLTPEELDFSDNDQLASFLAGMMQAEMLILLSNIDGLYTEHPSKPGAKKVEEVREITPGIEAYVSGKKSTHGLGGMASKIEAAKLLSQFGIDMVLANSREQNILQKIFTGERIGTIFFARKDQKKSSIRTWLAAGATEHGSVVLDCPATEIFGKKKSGISVLGVGVKRVHGEFAKGVPIAIIGDSGEKIGRGVARMSAADMRSAMEAGNTKGKIFIHTDSLFLF
jgi:glutamate 5-kinase